jgi:hypothetical protein
VTDSNNTPGSGPEYTTSGQPRVQKGDFWMRAQARNKGKPSQANALLAAFMDNYRARRTPAGDGYAVSQREAPSIAIPLRGRGGSLRQKLSADMFELDQTAVSQEALSTALTSIDGLCLQSDPPVPLHLRAARQGADAFLDLGRPDGRVAVISPGFWEITDRPPVVFRRTPLTDRLPAPAAPGQGSADAVRHLFGSIPDEGAWSAALACRVAALLYPTATHPVEIFAANTSGALKTSSARNMKRWTDPGPSLPMPADRRSWAVTASNGYQVLMENVSSIPAWWSDAVCRGSSGDSWADRALYEDNEVAAWKFSVVPIIEGIGVVSARADLADRTLRHHLVRPTWYLGDDEAEDAWQAAHPAALGGLLDLAAQVSALHVSGRLPRPRAGRLAVYEWVLAAVDVLRGNNGAGAAWLAQNKAAVAADAIASQHLPAAIAAMIKAPWSGTAQDLLRDLAGALPERDENGKPWNAVKTGLALPDAVDALSKAGWCLERIEAGHAKTRVWSIWPPGTWQRYANGAVRLPAALNGSGDGAAAAGCVAAMLAGGLSGDDAARVVRMAGYAGDAMALVAYVAR